MKFNIEQIIKDIKGSYPDKYNEYDFEQFEGLSAKIKTKKAMISLIENWFDIDTLDAKDMLRGNYVST